MGPHIYFSTDGRVFNDNDVPVSNYSQQKSFFFWQIFSEKRRMITKCQQYGKAVNLQRHANNK